jgi:hypothetical protein
VIQDIKQQIDLFAQNFGIASRRQIGVQGRSQMIWRWGYDTSRIHIFPYAPYAWGDPAKLVVSKSRDQSLINQSTIRQPLLRDFPSIEEAPNLGRQ